MRIHSGLRSSGINSWGAIYIQFQPFPGGVWVKGGAVGALVCGAAGWCGRVRGALARNDGAIWGRTYVYNMYAHLWT